ncbi:glycosyltransferase family 4 protein [Cupriavidus taiwanensis]|uniref:glycosyltransferase family 4 protein n=1 Tax=Cupriavidus taiwanensis TaxID=164546 RepID=UPI000E105787|nr:glycosyltransferase family 4 protein [Cupriavidus taiwanensis]SOY42575.1 putative glycosyl transferase, group 1 [Cupriavidus taiwanensis]SOY44619.1 putative glycosyl transferase, group 1 [Cupriavidus taiwanensis]SOY80394.1 putative glycosyl transferase, group 1 [Cupriavidus taiwanensis]SOZ21422.1 putative glycosyl transferase, group 1 [Cupriavidus taiwanensis]SOZ51917.1 putative glycosyl transferase, group 1 [Cupriavidus taiwanensis]
MSQPEPPEIAPPLPDLLIFSAPFHPSVGGMERFAEDLALGLTELGYRIELATRTPAGAGDAPAFPYPVTRVAGMAELARAMLRHPLVVFVGLTFYDVLLATVLLRRIVLTHHGPYSNYGETRRFTAGNVKRWMSRFYDNICVSRYLAGWLPGQPLVIHNGYCDDLFKSAAAPRQPGSFAFVGRLVTEKGVDLLLRSFARLRALRPEVRLTVIGDGPQYAVLVALAATLECAEAVTFAGAQPAAVVATMLAQHACLVVPSIGYEPFGIVALEGLAAGCEVIVTRRGGLPEAVDGFGWVTEPREDSLCETMLAVCAGESHRREPSLRLFLADHQRKTVVRRYAEAIAGFMRR